LAAIVVFNRNRLPRESDKASDVQLVVLNSLVENLHIIQLRRAPAGNRGISLDVFLRDALRAVRRVVRRLVHDTTRVGVVRVQIVFALRESLWMALHANDFLLFGSRQRHDAVVDGKAHLADDVQTILQQKVVVAVNRPAE